MSYLVLARKYRPQTFADVIGQIDITDKLKAALASVSPLTPVLVGVSLSVADQRELPADFPKIHFIFFVPDPAGEANIVVDPVEAWTAVARAAGSNRTTASVLFPPDSPLADRNRFAEVWHKAGGGALTSWVWPDAGNLTTETGAVFQWVGPDADARIVLLSPKIPIHGHPGTVRAPGAGGLTWKIREQGLGEFLWTSAWNPEKKSHFLPLETVPANR